MPRLPIASFPARLAAIGVLTAALVTVAAPPASAAGCQFFPETHQAIAFAADTDTEVRLAADGANLEANGISCGALTNIDAVEIDMAALSGGRVVFDLAGGPLGPGFTNEANGSSEIEFWVSGLSSLGTLHVEGSPGSDGITFGQATVAHLNLNANVDGVTPDVDVEFPVGLNYVSADGDAGDDVVSAAGARDALTPYESSTILTGGSGSNQLVGGTGNDELRIHTELVSTGSDVVQGGGGFFDRVTITTDSPALVSLFSLDDVANDGVGCPGASCEGDNIGSDISFVSGSTASETLIGREGVSDVLLGGGGEDDIRGLSGADTLICAGGQVFGGPDDDFITTDPGCDLVSGGTGRDAAYFYNATGSVSVTLDGVANDEQAGTLMNVRADIENVTGSSFGDTLVGNGKRNVLIGGDGADAISGGGANDRLEGGKGSDSLGGGAGDDRLLGGAGNDTLDGGDDVDICKQGTGTGSVVNCE